MAAALVPAAAQTPSAGKAPPLPPPPPQSLAEGGLELETPREASAKGSPSARRATPQMPPPAAPSPAPCASYPAQNHESRSTAGTAPRSSTDARLHPPLPEASPEKAGQQESWSAE